MIRIYARITGGVIENVIDVDPQDCGDFDLAGYIDITDMQPRPGINWVRSGNGWEALQSLPVVIEAPVSAPAIPTPQGTSMQDEEKHDTVVPEQEEHVNGLTENNRSTTTEGDGVR